MINLSKLWNQTRNRPLIWDTITTTGWNSLGKAVGFLIPFFIAAWFGVTSGTDAFFFAYGLIIFIAHIFAPVIQAIIVPYITELKANNKDVGKFVGRILGVSGFWLLLISGAFLLLAKPALSVITHFDSQELALINLLLIETVPLIVLLVWTSILAGALNSYKKFTFPAISPAFRAVVNLIIIFMLKDRFGIHAIAWGYLVGEVIRLFILLYAVRYFNLFKANLSFQFDAKLKEFLKTASYQIIGMAAIELNPIVDKTMASWLGKGKVSVLQYADRLYMIPIAFMSTGVMITLLSHWSSRYYGFGPKKLKLDVKKTIKVIGFISLLIMLLLLLFNQRIVRFAFNRGALAQEEIFEVSRIWKYYLLGFLPYMLTQVYVRAHLVLKNTKILMKCGFYMVFLNGLFNYFFMKKFQVAGIAFATTFVSIFTLLYLIIFFNKNLGKKI